ncbi:MAG: hypothetical protein ACXAD7_22475 [Candidatus Kariarchaeaceae archaeon]|jgi:hypothetical protein
MDTKYQNMDKVYTCNNCNTNITAPMHCGHPMHLENLEDGVHWVCWMGTGCGKSDYNACCNSPSLPVV